MNTFWVAGIGLLVLSLLSALAIILSAVGLPFDLPFFVSKTYALADTEQEIWALLFTCMALGVVISSLGRSRAVASPPDADRPASVIETFLLGIGLLCALLIFLCGIRAYGGFDVRSTYDLWVMFLAAVGLAIFSLLKGRAISEWFSEERRAERARARRQAAAGNA